MKVDKRKLEKLERLDEQCLTIAIAIVASILGLCALTGKDTPAWIEMIKRVLIAPGILSFLYIIIVLGWTRSP